MVLMVDINNLLTTKLDVCLELLALFAALKILEVISSSSIMARMEKRSPMLLQSEQ